MLQRIVQEDGLQDLSQEIMTWMGDDRILLLDAEMGSGKTTLIKSLCTVLGVEDEVQSPTYSIVNEYIGKKHKIFHFDLYRIEDEAELWDLGFEEYLDQDAYVFIEWPSIGSSFYPENVCLLSIKKINFIEREYNLSR